MNAKKKTAQFALYNINSLVFITQAESVYSAVRTESLYNRYFSSLKVQVNRNIKAWLPKVGEYCTWTENEKRNFIGLTHVFRSVQKT